MALMIKRELALSQTHTTNGVVSGTVDQDTSCTRKAATGRDGLCGGRVLSNMGCECTSGVLYEGRSRML